ncbi:putative Aminopeptidase [Rhodotorula toruloides ATCC 204091]|uniref:Peptide hydrolase n=1 Tax=Rhodotorula toruloides TaxID=5286 RepID=A0A0K3CM66_RHOTO|nr:putative Aminopeptidase [Rhodotorula toruloides ATCC 204091]PRQ72254.1 putative Aminopeptidase [Rhodotorula toruloides]
MLSVAIGRDNGEVSEGAEGVRDIAGLLYWLHPTTVETDSSLSSDSPSASSAQITFSSTNAALDTIPELEPMHLLDLPSKEGRLVLLSSDSTTADAQLSYMSSHPAYSQYSLVALPRLSTALDGPSPFPEVPAAAVNRVKAHLEGLTFQPLLSKVISGLDSEKELERMKRDVRTLSGEDQSRVKPSERWVSRHSMSTGGHKAANWVLDQMSSYGFNCTHISYLPGYAPMVECVYLDSALGLDDSDLDRSSSIEYNANETMILGAHFDSRGSFGFPTAPGADDDASGTALVLTVARLIHSYNLKFARKLVLALFSGEEQGLLSSSHYASLLRQRSEDVALMLQVDMVGYRKPGEPMQLARPDKIGLREAGWLVGNLSEVYVPELVVGYTPACCSDHQSFVSNSYASTWIFERNGAIADPCYHNSCDLSAREGYSFEQISAHAKVAMGLVWEVAGGWVP